MATTYDNPLRLVRQLKGAPLAVLIVCQIVRTVVTRDFLCQQTGYSENIVSNAIGYLCEHQFITRVTGGWMIATAAQLPLMAALPDGEEVVTPVENAVPEKREKCAFGKVVTVRSTSSESDKIKACMDVLKDAGIFGKRAQEIAEADHVTVDYIKAHLAHIETETWDNPQGMVIWRMLEGMPAPEISSANHSKDCRCSACIQAKVDRFMNRGTTAERGKRRGTETSAKYREVLIAVAEFMEHDPGCDCFDCQMARLSGVGSVCPVCKHYNCECLEDEASQGIFDE